MITELSLHINDASQSFHNGDSLLMFLNHIWLFYSNSVNRNFDEEVNRSPSTSLAGPYKGSMNRNLLETHVKEIKGTISCFDRLIFYGNFQEICRPVAIWNESLTEIAGDFVSVLLNEEAAFN